MDINYNDKLYFALDNLVKACHIFFENQCSGKINIENFDDAVEYGEVILEDYNLNKLKKRREMNIKDFALKMINEMAKSKDNDAWSCILGITPMKITNKLIKDILESNFWRQNYAWRKLLMNHLKKPPLGIKPRYIMEHERYIEIAEAILRYAKENEECPQIFIDELYEFYCKNIEEKCNRNGE